MMMKRFIFTGLILLGIIFNLQAQIPYYVLNGKYRVSYGYNGSGHGRDANCPALETKDENSKIGSPLQIWNFKEGKCQHWCFLSVGRSSSSKKRPDLFKITTDITFKALEVAPNGVDVQIAEWTGADNQIWKVVSNSQFGYQIINKKTGKALCIDGSLKNGVKVITIAPSTDSSQLWWLF